jgi:hypothetical protein
LTNEPALTQDVLIQVSKKGKDLYYLLPGQARGGRKRFVRDMIVGAVVGLITAGMLAGIFYALQP